MFYFSSIFNWTIKINTPTYWCAVLWSWFAVSDSDTAGLKRKDSRLTTHSSRSVAAHGDKVSGWEGRQRNWHLHRTSESSGRGCCSCHCCCINKVPSLSQFYFGLSQKGRISELLQRAASTSNSRWEAATESKRSRLKSIMGTTANMTHK